MLKNDNTSEKIFCIVFGGIFGMLSGMTIAVIIAGILWCGVSIFSSDLASTDLFNDVTKIGSMILGPAGAITGGIFGSKTL